MIAILILTAILLGSPTIPHSADVGGGIPTVQATADDVGGGIPTH
jgi:hypothetical protein